MGGWGGGGGGGERTSLLFTQLLSSASFPKPTPHICPSDCAVTAVDRLSRTWAWCYPILPGPGRADREGRGGEGRDREGRGGVGSDREGRGGAGPQGPVG